MDRLWRWAESKSLNNKVAWVNEKRRSPIWQKITVKTTAIVTTMITWQWRILTCAGHCLHLWSYLPVAKPFGGTLPLFSKDTEQLGQGINHDSTANNITKWSLPGLLGPRELLRRGGIWDWPTSPVCGRHWWVNQAREPKPSHNTGGFSFPGAGQSQSFIHP